MSREKFGLRIAECGVLSRHSRDASSSRPSPSSLQPKTSGLTLIELMVVIVILMTLVGGVIPLISPNNDSRKIRDASRGLQTYILQAQARVARSGRPAGIAFRETSPGSGVAMEVFQIEIPMAYTGFSSASSASFHLNPDGETYTINLGEGYVFFDPNLGPVPPRFAKPGDLIEVGDRLFSLERDGSKGKLWDRDGNGIPYFQDSENDQNVTRFTIARPADNLHRPFPRDQNDPNGHDSSPTRYRLLRQPVTTSASPYTLPAGVALDMSASGTEGGATPTLFASNYDGGTVKQIGIVFSPSGGIDSIHYSNGEIFGPNAEGDSMNKPITDASRVFMLLGRVENVLNEADMNSKEGLWTAVINSQTSNEQLADLQDRINWLNLDSRWIVCDARSGRTVVTENAFVDPRGRYEGQSSVKQAWNQVGDAREFARQMKSGR